jgi:8-oxo-dGTP pyrophosphatase MutT (NUDIX family)
VKDAIVEKVTPVYEGRVIHLNIERVQLPNGNTADLEIMHHPGGAAVVVIDDQERICLLNQYRHAANGWLWEIPAGKIDNREPPFETVKREIEEEAGRTAKRWDFLGEYVSSPGVFTEIIHLYMARDLAEIATRPEEHEVFEVHWIKLQEALVMASDGRIRDGKSLIGVFWAAQRLQSEKAGNKPDTRA